MIRTVYLSSRYYVFSRESIPNMSIAHISWFELPFIEYFEQKLMRDISNFESSKSHTLKFQIETMHILNMFYKIVA